MEYTLRQDGHIVACATNPAGEGCPDEAQRCPACSAGVLDNEALALGKLDIVIEGSLQAIPEVKVLGRRSCKRVGPVEGKRNLISSPTISQDSRMGDIH